MESDNEQRKGGNGESAGQTGEKIGGSNQHGLVIGCIVYIVLVMVVISTTIVEFEAKPVNVFRFLSIISLAAIGLMVFLRPFLASMPFKVGNTIKSADLLAKWRRSHS